MKTNVRETSLDAYDYLRFGKCPTLGERQQAVYNLIFDYGKPITDQEIAHELGFSDPNSVRPIRFELVKMGFVVEGGRRKCSRTKRRAITWMVNPVTAPGGYKIE